MNKENNQVISDDIELAETFNNYFESALANLSIKGYENNVTDNTNSGSKDGVDLAIEKYKDHPSIKIMNQNVSFGSRFSFKDINETDIQKEISNLNSKKAGAFENIPTKVLKELTPAYKKNDPTL